MIVLVHNEQTQKSLDVILDYMWHVIRKTKLYAFGTLRSCSAADFPQSQFFVTILPEVLLIFAEFSKFCIVTCVAFSIEFAKTN